MIGRFLELRILFLSAVLGALICASIFRGVISDALGESRLIDIAVIPVTALIASVVLNRLVAARVSRMVAAAQRFRAGDPSARCQVSGPDEIGCLGESLDALFGAFDTKEVQLRKECEPPHEANYDPLTGLPNRVLAFDRLTQALTASKRDKLHVAILFLNLNNLAKVNSDIGHTGGDAILKSAAERMSAVICGSHTIARLGNDEFLVVVEKLDVTAPAEIVARCLLDTIAEPFLAEDLTLYLTARIGIAIYPQDGESAGGLIRNARAAAVRVKEKGGNAYRFFTAGMDHEAAQRLQMEASLRHAVENERLELYYQPKLSMDGRIVGAEALARWLPQDMEPIPPDIFIPLAESAGLIHKIGLWVLETACRQAVVWHRVAGPGFSMAINASAVQLNLPFLEDIQRVLSETGLKPQCLTIEITERALIDTTEHALFILDQIKEMGVKTSIDDFGTGYSAMSYLLQNAFDELKIDRSFISGLPASDEGTVITTAIVGMAQSLKMTVVAEGVETREEAEFLRWIGCDVMQGYLFSPAVSAECFLELLGAQLDAQVS